eukprot:4647528-Pleurochrysis_carterae.AAC.6
MPVHRSRTSRPSRSTRTKAPPPHMLALQPTPRTDRSHYAGSFAGFSRGSWRTSATPSTGASVSSFTRQRTAHDSRCKGEQARG